MGLNPTIERPLQASIDLLDPLLTDKIALTHPTEFPDYYTS